MPPKASSSSAEKGTVVTSRAAYVKALLHCYKHPTQSVCGFLIGKTGGDVNINSNSNNNNNNTGDNADGATATSSNNTATSNSNNNNNAATTTTSTSSNGCYVADALPLFHSLPVGAPHPMLEVAYAHALAAARPRGLSLLGLYFANERLDDVSISPLMKSVLDWLQARMAGGGGGGNGASSNNNNNNKSASHNNTNSVGGGGRPLVWIIDNRLLTTPPAPGRVALECFPYNSADALTRVSKLNSNNNNNSESNNNNNNNGGGGGGCLLFGGWNGDTVGPEASDTAEAAVGALHDALDALAQYALADFEDHLEDPSVNYLEQPPFPDTSA